MNHDQQPEEDHNDELKQKYDLYKEGIDTARETVGHVRDVSAVISAAFGHVWVAAGIVATGSLICFVLYLVRGPNGEISQKSRDGPSQSEIESKGENTS